MLKNMQAGWKVYNITGPLKEKCAINVKPIKKKEVCDDTIMMD